ncbi:uncharacterized protein AKAW2_70473S [Aspergillus luchuensis]|uniref:Uncharacterized protein n=1 Tax=Aspergillus kawachii TaxID=1069201 RepID=A0A7R8A3Z1_ASPKA|nr:uncharacterized protein AKAW2_70473S [Aspergillus luchuensis]BCS03595.1 hypothetical protein AKAW2_70473S [Aspergillus luchuensis]
MHHVIMYQVIAAIRGYSSLSYRFSDPSKLLMESIIHGMSLPMDLALPSRGSMSDFFIRHGSYQTWQVGQLARRLLMQLRPSPLENDFQPTLSPKPLTSTYHKHDRA